MKFPLRWPSTRHLALAGEEDSLRVLLAEENPRMREILSFILRRDGHEVVAKTNGSAVLEALSSGLLDAADRRFHVIISEDNLPGFPGLAILASLRAWHQDTPFILITRNPNLHDQARGLGALVLSHPFTLQAIRSLVRESVESGHRTRAAPAGAAVRP